MPKWAMCCLERLSSRLSSKEMSNKTTINIVEIENIEFVMKNYLLNIEALVYRK